MNNLKNQNSHLAKKADLLMLK